MKGPRTGGLLALRILVIAGLACRVLSSCVGMPPAASQASVTGPSAPAGAPATATPGGAETPVGAPQAPSPPGAAVPAPATTGGTAIQTLPAGTLSKAQTERRAIEESLAFGSPTSLSKAFELLRTSTALERSELQLLAWVGARIASIIYPLRSPTFVPQDLQNQGEIPTGAFARMISEALSGRVPELPKENAGGPLAEILPALAVFRSDSRETARLALVSLERFDLLGPPSVIPSIVRGLDAERRKAWKESLGSYLKAVKLAEDSWPALIGAARAELALGQPALALELVGRAPAEIQGDSDFRKVKAEALYENASFSEADPLIALALRDDQLDATLILMRAHLLVRAKQYQQALPLLDAYATVDQTDRLLLILRSLASEGLRSRDEALRWARKGLGLYPDDPEFLVLTARLVLANPSLAGADKAQALEEARANAARAFELTGESSPQPEGLSPARLLGRSDAGNEAARLLLDDLAQRFDWIQALRYIDRARRAPGFTNEALIGLILRRAGEWSRALDHATLWYRGSPASEAAAEAYLRALIGSGNIKAAEDLLPRLLLGINGTTAGRSNLHFLQSQLAKTEESALAALRTALVENADNVEALLGMYDIYYRRQDWQKARFYFKQASSLSPSDPEIVRRSRELDAISP